MKRTRARARKSVQQKKDIPYVNVSSNAGTHTIIFISITTKLHSSTDIPHYYAMFIKPSIQHIFAFYFAVHRSHFPHSSKWFPHPAFTKKAADPPKLAVADLYFFDVFTFDMQSGFTFHLNEKKASG